jgi:hypothetical protein
MSQLGAHVYNPDDPESQPVQHCRLIFLARIESVAPEVLQSLHDDVLPAYAAWAEGAPPHYRHWTTVCGFADRLRELTADRISDALALLGAPDPRPVVVALRTWGERFGLLDNWIMDDALSTLHWWAMYPPKRLEWHADGWGTMVPEFPPLTLSWEPTFTTWAEFERHAHRELRRYRAEVEAVADGYGLRPAPTKRGDVTRHFDWLVHYQVNGSSYAQIAVEYDVGDFTTVQKALHGTATTIGLTLRRL